MKPDSHLNQAYNHCQQLTRREAANFYYAFLTLPPPKRKAIYAAYAFCRHCDDSVDQAASPSAKQTALDALQTQLNDAYHDRPHTPLFTALADTAQRYHIPQDYFIEIIRGVQTDLTKTRYQTFPELRQYCYQVASVVGLICLQIFQYNPQSANEARQRAIDLGLAMQLTNIMRDIREDWRLGRIYLPQDEMAHFGYTEHHLAQGTHNHAFTALLQYQEQRARTYFRSGFRLLPHLSRRSRACPAALASIYWRLLNRIQASNYNVLTPQRITLTGPEKARTAARAWLSALLSLPNLPP